MTRRTRARHLGPRGKRTTAEPAAPQPWLAAVLAVDTGKVAGWSICVAGVQREFGECNTTDASAVLEIVEWAVKLAAHAGVPLVMVVEQPWGGTVSTVAGLGGARERWRRAWDDAGQAPGRIVKVNVSEWRAVELGGHWVSQPREVVRPHEQLIAALLVGEPVGGDEAPALLIGHWASRAAKVGRVIGKRAVVASRRAWARAA